MVKPKPNIAVLFHKGCTDGFGGAWAAWKKFGTDATYIPVEHSMPPPDLQNTKIYLIDFCYPKEIIDQLMIHNEVAVIDHHISEKSTTTSLKEHRFALDHSGATLAWMHFHMNEPIPKLLQYVEDVDLWRFQFPETKALIASLDTYPFEFPTWDDIADAFEDDARQTRYRVEGEAILKYYDLAIRRMLSRAETVEFEGHRALAVNASFLISEIGAALVNQGYPIAIVWNYKRGRIRVSLRSSEEADVSVIAKKYGGGGHAQSSGFVLDDGISFPWVPTES